MFQKKRITHMTQNDLHQKLAEMQSRIAALETENQQFRQTIESQKNMAALFTALTNNMQDMIALTDMAGNFTFVGKAHETLGYDPDFLIGKNVMDFVHPHDRPQVREKLNDLIASEGSGLAEYRYLSKNGTYLWFETAGKVLNDAPDGTKKIIFNSRDVTERRKTENALRESQTRFKALHNASFGGIAIHDRGKILECNQGLSEITGYAIDELMGMDGLLLISAKTRDMVLRNILSGYETPYEAIGVRKNGEEYPLRLEARNIPYKGKNVRVVEFRDITESKKADKALRESEKKYRLIAENMSDVISILDMDLGFTYVSPSIKRLTGYTVEEALQHSIEDILTPESLKKVVTVFEEEMALEASGTADPSRSRIIEIEQSKKDISIVWVEVACSFIRDAEHKPTGILLISRDITGRKEIERSLQESEKKYRMLFQNVSEGILIAKGEKVDLANPAMLKIMEYPLEIFTTKPFIEFIHPDDRETVLERHLKRLSGEPVETNYPFRIIAGNGKAKWVQIHSSIIEWNGEPASLSLVSDISERKRREIERERLIAAIAHSGEVIMITDPEGKIQYVNPAFEKITGYSRAEAIGQTPRLLNSGHQDELFYRELWDTIASGKIWTGRMVNKKKDGSLFTEDATISAVYDSEGHIVNYVAAKRDITEHLQISKQLQQAQKMESIGRLAGGVAHDFNNLLGVILGFTEMAMEKTEPHGELHDDLSEIFNAARRSTGIVQQLLAFARKQIICPILLDLNATVSGILKMLRRLIGEHIEFVWRPGKNLWPVMMDPSQIDQILANLCVNARDAISDIGTIAIKTENITIDTDFCSEYTYFSPGEYVLTTVSDTGCGMDKATRKNIFEPFFTTKETGKGTGLGLSTVYGIVKQNKGFIRFDSKPGKGTTFFIYLPRHEKPSKKLPEKTPVQKIPPGKETILLVEDEAAILKMTKRILEKLGYAVLVANTPGEAIHLAKNYHDEIHLLMTDVIMPEMNGRDLARHILSVYPDISCFFMSGYTADIIAHHGVLEADVHFIHKPFTARELAVKLRKALDKKTH